MTKKKSSSNSNSRSNRSNRSNRRKASGPANMRISRRVVNVKRHTVGYMIGGKMQSVSQTRRLAAAGRVAGVQVVGNHVQARPGRRRLSDLPTTLRK